MMVNTCMHGGTNRQTLEQPENNALWPATLRWWRNNKKSELVLRKRATASVS